MNVQPRRVLIAVGVLIATGLVGVWIEMHFVMAFALGALIAARIVFGTDRRAIVITAVALIAWAFLLPLFHPESGGFIDDAVLAAAYAVMALGLNIIVGFAGLLDLGYVAFFALGSLTAGWLMSGFVSGAGGGEGLHLFVSGFASELPGLHVNFILVAIAAVMVCTIAGVLIGLPTLRLRGDYIAIVTLAFGEIIYRFVLNGDEVVIAGQKLTNGRQGITPVDKIDLPFIEPFKSLDLRPWFWLALVMLLLVLFVNYRLRDSRLGRAWIALREDEVAAASMGVPLVKTKLFAYGTGAAFGGMSGAFLASLLNTVNADQFQFSFSIFILGMIILGGLGSIEGVVLGAVVLTYINFRVIPDVLNPLANDLNLGFDPSELSFGIFGFLLVIMMVLRPQGLIPERRRKLELVDHVGTGTTTGVGAIEMQPTEATYETRA